MDVHLSVLQARRAVVTVCCGFPGAAVLPRNASGNELARFTQIADVGRRIGKIIAVTPQAEQGWSLVLGTPSPAD